MRIGSPQEFRRTMTDWLSATWEASWRPFQYFNLYRLILAGVVLLAGLLPEGWVASLHLGYSLAFMLAALLYLAAVSYTHLRAHETVLDLVCRLLLEKKNKKTKKKKIRLVKVN